MRFIYSYLALLLCPVLLFSSFEESFKRYLKGRISKKDKRCSTFLLAFELMEERNAQVLVETGTARGGGENFVGDGGGTILFSLWATDHDAILYSVDIDEQALEEAGKAIQNFDRNTELVQCDSIEFLSNFTEPIDFLYLDSYDLDLKNPKPSQRHHLKEIKAAYPHLHQNSVVMIDDCAFSHGGKGKDAIHYLKERGWKVIASGYQSVLIQ